MNKKALYIFILFSLMSPFFVFAQSPTDSVRTQLDQIDNIQSTVTNLVPKTYLEKAEMLLAQLNLWREKLSWYYLGMEGEIDHKMNQEALVGTQFDPNNTDGVQKPLEKKGIMDVLSNMWEYTQLAFYSFMAFIFANKYIFYVFAIIMILICLRVIYKVIFH